MKIPRILWCIVARWCLRQAERQMGPSHPDIPEVVFKQRRYDDRLKELLA